MSTRTRGALLAPVTLVLALAAGACGGTEEAPSPSAPVPATTGAGPDQTSSAAPTAAFRSISQQAFLDDLAGLGLPTGMSADTTVEVGIGICRNLDDGVDTRTILEHIRSLTSAIANQSPDHDTDRVGQAIVEASRTHLCG